ncbi:hypothetical protein Q5752_004405 [Cryptotrichosporon argae]
MLRPGPSVLALLALLLASLFIQPRPQSRHFFPSRLAAPLPMALLPLPPRVLETFPRPWRAARPVEHLAIAYAVLGAAAVGWRAGLRFARGRPADDAARAKDTDEDKGKGKPARAGPRPVIQAPLAIAALLHLASWRLMAAPPAGAPTDWAWPYDLSTVLGLGVAVVVVLGETGRLLRLGAGPRGNEPTESLGWSRLVHALLAMHRFSLALRVLSAGLDRTPPVGLPAPP